MSAAYQGRALWAPPRARRRRVKPGWIVLGVLALTACVWAGREGIARSPVYRALFTVRQVEVTGCTYLTESEVRKAAGLEKRQDFLAADLRKAEKRLANQARIERARVHRALPRRIVVAVTERRPAAIVRAGRLLEADARGVILPPVASGVLPDVPVVSGVTVKDARAGKRIEDPDFARALAHLAALSRPSIGLPRPVSQVDVASPERTVVTLAPEGIDIVLPRNPPEERILSSVRVVLADLEMRGLSAARIDLTGEEVVAVRPVPAAALAADSLATRPRETRRG